MKLLKNSKRVSWASGAKLCQVKFFLSKDCPSKVSLQAQDCQRAKTWASCLKNDHSVNHHSRFEGGCSTDPLQEKPSDIAQIKWKCPPKLGLSYNWHVVAGEESEEAETQKHREMRVLEAVYPRMSDIPHSPSLPMDSQEYQLDDSRIPIIPITPIEEEEAVDLLSDMAPPQNSSFEAQSPALPQSLLSMNPNAPQSDPQPCVKSSANEKLVPEVLPGFQADVGVAVVAAITAILKGKEQGSLIDTDLLIKVLSDPKMIEILVSEQPAPDNAKTEPVYGSIPSPVAEMINKDGILTDTGSTSISGSNVVTSSVATSSLRHGPVIKKLDNELGAAANIGAPNLTPSVAVPWLNPDPVIEKLVQKYGAPIDKGISAPLSGSKPSSPKPDPLMDKLIQEHIAPADTAVGASVSGSYPMTSRVAFPSPKSVPVVKKLIHELGVPNDAGSAPFYLGKLLTPPPFSLPNLTQEDVKIKRMTDGYGILDRIGNEPISRSMPLSNMDLMSSASKNLCPLSKIGDTGLQFKGLSPDHARANLITLPYVAQPSSLAKAFSLDSAPVSVFSAISAAPPVKDINYMKSLIRLHGDSHETQDFSLSQSGKFDVHFHDMKQAPSLIPTELKPKSHVLQKPCIYFNSPKGCRNGSNCLYRHDMPRKLQPGSGLEIPHAKRLKLGGEIIGRT
ncbi:hypothetical protein RHMOL_Rhmol10G0303400 [Rhododendron molle]|uniref:Uncharacterized protein n=1 Tax=Rhododendron molle TaxID=49168 RepID=A0ACC0M8C2_RHOML|nr:hypothetical protein RHMOL_Rhmol10G0303400 [Rhododendron molle]